MEIVGNSSIWVEKYRPKTINDLILPEDTKTFFKQLVVDGEISNLLFTSSPGRGKTTSAFALCIELNADTLYVNGSMETSIDVLRYKVSNFAMSGSFKDGKKVVIIDEAERISIHGQDAMKSLIEQTESNCRFILTTNNISKIIDPIKSRCQVIDFDFTKKEAQSLMLSYFKRICWILEQENFKYDKKPLAEYVQVMYPDFRKTLNELQKYTKSHDSVGSDILQCVDINKLNDLLQILKEKKFDRMRKIATEIDPDQFYITFYNELDNHVKDECKPNIIMTLGRYVYESGLTVNKEITLVSCLTDLMGECQWK